VPWPKRHIENASRAIVMRRMHRRARSDQHRTLYLVSFLLRLVGHELDRDSLDLANISSLSCTFALVFFVTLDLDPPGIEYPLAVHTRQASVD